MADKWTLALVAYAGIGAKTLKSLNRFFPDSEAVISASFDDLLAVPGVGPQIAKSIKALDPAAADVLMGRCKQQGIEIVGWGDSLYPPNLLRVEDAPPLLFVRGNVSAAGEKSVAIVGTRMPTTLGSTVAYSLGSRLADRGWTVTSGLALGIDTAAHQGALDADGKTVAVLACGVDSIYPPQNEQLAEALVGKGAILSEQRPGTKVNAQRLMARNRITSGLSLAVIVVEATQDSGSVSTARRAQGQERLVFAVEGGDAGCAELIAAGAHPLRVDIDGQPVDLEGFEAMVSTFRHISADRS